MPTGNLGDVNQDGIINIVDAFMIAQSFAGLNPANFNSANADTDCDSSINIIDALFAARYYAGLVSGFG